MHHNQIDTTRSKIEVRRYEEFLIAPKYLLRFLSIKAVYTWHVKDSLDIKFTVFSLFCLLFHFLFVFLQRNQ